MTKEFILVLDFGSPSTQLIAQRIRENHVFSRIAPYNLSAKEINLQRPKGIILSGGTIASTRSKKPCLPDRNIFKLDIPILGIGYGGEVIVQFFGGRVKSTKLPSFERCELFIDDTRNLFYQMPGNITCWTDSADYIKRLPKGFKKTAHTQNNPIVAVECPTKRVFAAGFHPEAVATQRGSQILGNFLYRICGCVGTWTMNAFIRQTLSSIKKTVGKKGVILNLTGSLDSAVTALLINKAIGKRLKCIFIDNGLLRMDEAKQIKRVFNRDFKLNLNYIERSQQFLHSLKGVIETEEKRDLINNLSVKVFQEGVKRITSAAFLAEGTHYPEGVESTNAPLPLKLKPLQPLKDLFKEEIRAVAKELDVPDNIIFRQPFPEAGLAVRIIGEVTPLRLKMLREAQSCLVEEIKAAGIYEQIWQSFVILLPYENVIALRCIASIDGMTADWVRLPYEVLERIARRILNKVKGITRVVYDISSQPLATIEWE
jgi:GMP synthase (glutamine-hydrolysing)